MNKMDMIHALAAHLEAKLVTGKLPPEEQAKLVDELHRVRRRIVRPRDASRDSEPITVGIEK